jgi:hypothetical protein
MTKLYKAPLVVLFPFAPPNRLTNFTHVSFKQGSHLKELKGVYLPHVLMWPTLFIVDVHY